MFFSFLLQTFSVTDMFLLFFLYLRLGVSCSSMRTQDMDTYTERTKR